MSQFLATNPEYFIGDFLQCLYETLALTAIYEHPSRREDTLKNLGSQLPQLDNPARVDDQPTIDGMRWLLKSKPKGKNFIRSLGLFNELVRVLLVEGKETSARRLFESLFEQFYSDALEEFQTGGWSVLEQGVNILPNEAQLEMFGDDKGDAAQAAILMIKETRAWKHWLELLADAKKLQRCDTFNFEGVNVQKYAADCQELQTQAKKLLSGISLPL